VDNLGGREREWSGLDSKVISLHKISKEGHLLMQLIALYSTAWADNAKKKQLRFACHYIQDDVTSFISS
jgi:hypothetical protein